MRSEDGLHKYVAEEVDKKRKELDTTFSKTPTIVHPDNGKEFLEEVLSKLFNLNVITLHTFKCISSKYIKIGSNIRAQIELK